MQNTTQTSTLFIQITEHKKVSIAVVVISIMVMLLLHYFTGIRDIPFHPDEASRIFCAQDFTTYLHTPFDLAWNSERSNDPLQRYRLIDSPLNNYIIGFGLLVSGEKIPTIDWSWSKTWEENVEAGALPLPRTLFVSRMSLAVWFIVSLCLAYLTSKNLHGYLAGCIALVFAGTNSLYLLHTRRAMGEGSLLASEYLVLYLLPKATKYPWLVGAAAGLAICAKQSAFPIAIVAGIAILWPDEKSSKPRRAVIRHIAWNLFQYTGIMAVIFIILNPIYWNAPLQAIKESLVERQKLIMAQSVDFGNNSLLVSPGKSVLGVVANTFILPPAFAETAQYRAYTAASENYYLSDPVNTSLRGIFAGGIYLGFTLAGIVIAVISLKKSTWAKRRLTALYLLAGLAQLLFILILLPVPWQRYVIPLVPFAIIWSSLAVVTPFLHYLKNRNVPPGK
jgi:hypothetical protein